LYNYFISSLENINISETAENFLVNLFPLVNKKNISKDELKEIKKIFFR
jgi:hypothetical protein